MLSLPPLPARCYGQLITASPCLGAYTVWEVNSMAVRLSDIEREQHFNLPVARQAVMLQDLCGEYMEHYAKVTKRSWQRDRRQEQERKGSQHPDGMGRRRGGAG